MRRFSLGVVTACLLLQACGSEPTLTEYAGQAEVLVATMNGRLDELDSEIEGSHDTDDIKRYARERVEARTTLLEGLRTLEPPDEVAELHDTAIEIVGRLTAAESALADHVEGLESLEGVDMWETPEGQAARAADDDAIALCLAAEEELDTADQAEGFENTPWIPAEMKEVVRVAFGCDAAGR